MDQLSYIHRTLVNTAGYPAVVKAGGRADFAGGTPHSLTTSTRGGARRYVGTWIPNGHCESFYARRHAGMWLDAQAALARTGTIPAGATPEDLHGKVMLLAVQARMDYDAMWARLVTWGEDAWHEFAASEGLADSAATVVVPQIMDTAAGVREVQAAR